MSGVLFTNALCDKVRGNGRNRGMTSASGHAVRCQRRVGASA
jgi:hypothetical protein